MSGYALNSITTLAPMVSSDKGDFSNRCNATKDQVVNNVKTSVVAAGVGAASGLTMRHALQGNNADKFAKVFDKSVNLVDKHISLGNDAKKFLKEMSGKGKAIAMIAIPTLMIAEYLHNKNIYQKGQIDQKYTDIANLEKHAKGSLMLDA